MNLYVHTEPVAPSTWEQFEELCADDLVGQTVVLFLAALVDQEGAVGAVRQWCDVQQASLTSIDD